MKLIFIDTNIFIYASGDSHPHKDPSLRILEQIAVGKIKAVTSAEVLQEILYRYAAIKDTERGFAVFDNCLKIMPVVLPLTKEDIISCRQILQHYPLISARDAAHAAVMFGRGIKIICSYDKHFDLLKEIQRIEPA